MENHKRTRQDTLLEGTAVALGIALSATAFYLAFNPQGRIVIPRSGTETVRSRPAESPRRVYSQGPYVDQALEGIIRNSQDARIVVGDQAPASDVLTATSIMNYLTQETGRQLSPSFCKLASEATQIGPSDTYFESAFNNRTIGVGVATWGNNKWIDLMRFTPHEPYEFPSSGTGSIQAYVHGAGKKSIVITGGNADDIARAAQVLTDHKKYDLHGAAINVYERDGKIQTEIVR